MKEQVKLVVLLPVGALSSKNQLSFIVDTIESIIHYTTPDRRIVIQDNSSPLHLGSKLIERFPELILVRAPLNYGMYGGLYKSLSLSLLHIHAAYDFQVLLKLDTDALITGPGLEEDAIDCFAAHPNVGEMGAYLYEGDGIEWPRNRLSFETGLLGWLTDRERAVRLRHLWQLAQANGYRAGEHILGGAAFYSPRLIDRLVQGDFLMREEIRRSKLQEDHLTGLLCKAVGLDLYGFQIPNHPLAVAYQGLPASPETLAMAGAKVIHSTRFWENRNETDIRAFFKARRHESVPVTA